MYNQIIRRPIIAAILGSAIASAALLDSSDRSSEDSKSKQTRSCLYCGKLHSHNNSFCSAECCRSWKLNGGKRTHNTSDLITDHTAAV